uniref:Uracil-DNA glycosylase n=1 Tax=Chaetoceros debilis TaxID=122233 RepID=A0A7S3VHK1_9STRA
MRIQSSTFAMICSFVVPLFDAIGTRQAMGLSLYTSGFASRTRASMSTGRRYNGNKAYRRTTPTMMPEGPEVRTLVDQLQSGVGKRLVNLKFVSGRYTTHGSPRGFDEFRKTMTNYKTDDGINDVIQEWNCKGKFIWVSLDKGSKVNLLDEDVKDDFHRSIWITLGMSGRFQRDAFLQETNDDGKTHNQPRWYFEFLDDDSDSENETKRIYYYDTRNFGTLIFSTSRKELTDKLKTLGPDILNYSDISEEIFMAAFRKPRQTMNVCKFLMDQKKIAGVGNYLLSEALYRSNLDPFADLREISDSQAMDLYKEIIDTSAKSYESQGVTRAKGGSYRDVDGNKGRFTFQLQCYGREYCPEGRKIIRETKGPHGRTIWYVEDQLFMPRKARDKLGMPQEESGLKKRTSPSKNISSAARTVDSEVSENSGNNGTENDLDLLDSLTDESWKESLTSFLTTEKGERISRFVASERRLHPVYPPPDQVFSALNKCPLESTKVVIIGQDPYHQKGQGHGLAFSVQKGIKIPPSLRNIFKELAEDEGIFTPQHGNLESWANQGVLLLNTVLTVQHGKANSHSKMGWEDFTDEIVELLDKEKKGLVFLLWGGPAAKKGKGINQSRHTVITTSHPSPLGATKTKNPFLVSTINR